MNKHIYKEFLARDYAIHLIQRDPIAHFVFELHEFTFQGLWHYIYVSPALRRQRLEDYEFKANPCSIENLKSDCGIGDFVQPTNQPDGEDRTKLRNSGKQNFCLYTITLQMK